MRTRRARRWQWVAAGCFLFLCAAIGAVGFVLGTSPGRHWLANRISAALSSGSQTVRVEQIHLARGMRLAVGRVAASDAAGCWLEMRGIETRWALRSLLAGRLKLRSLRVEQFHWMCLPAASETTSEEDFPLDLPEFAVEELEVSDVRLSAGVAGVPVAVSHLLGRVEGGGSGAVGVGVKVHAQSVGVDTTTLNHVVADLRLGYSGADFDLSGSLEGDGFRASGQVQFPGRGTWPTGHVLAEVEGTSGLLSNPYPGLTIEKVTASANCAPQRDGQEVAQIRLDATHLRLGEMFLGAATVSTQVKRSREEPVLRIEADSRLEDFQIAHVVVTGAEVRVAGPWGNFDISGKAVGNYVHAFALEAGGRLQWGGDRWDAELNQATARWADMRSHLTEPIQVQMQGDQSSIRGEATVEPFDVATLFTGLGKERPEGQLAAKVRLGGTLALPEIRGEATWGPVVLRSGAWAALPPVEGSCQTSVSGGVWRLSTSIQAGPHGNVQAEAQMPLSFSMVPWELNPDADGDCRLNLQAGLNLALFNDTEYFASSRMGGQVDLSVAHQGPLQGGTVTGTCVLARGEYENYVLGTVIREASMRWVSNGDSLVMESGSATDGGKGRLTLKGRVQLNPAAGFPYEFALDLRKASLLRRPDAEAMVTGKVLADGALSRLDVKGDLQLDNAVVDLRNLRMPAPAVLEPDSNVKTTVEDSPADESLSMRLALSIPGTLYVRSRELDSAWAGNLVLEQESGRMGLSGYLEPRRGTLLLLKRRFKLEEGRIDFDHRWPPEPQLRLTAAFSRADLSARVQLIGSVGNPELTLTSEPPLPKDEIMARILFGEDVSSLTPLQALSLASEASSLGKVGGGAGWLGKVQSAVGIDRVEIRENGQDSTQSEVAVGKYLGDRSYIEMRRATAIDTTDRARFYMEHELWPNIVVEAESGLEMRSGIGLFWKRDY